FSLQDDVRPSFWLCRGAVRGRNLCRLLSRSSLVPRSWLRKFKSVKGRSNRRPCASGARLRCYLPAGNASEVAGDLQIDVPDAQLILFNLAEQRKTQAAHAM